MVYPECNSQTTAKRLRVYGQPRMTLAFLRKGRGMAGARAGEWEQRKTWQPLGLVKSCTHVANPLSQIK